MISKKQQFKPVTMTSIARELSLSRSTVSRVLNGSYSQIGIPDETASAVISLANKLGYRRHAGAIALHNHRFDAVGVLSSAATPRGSMMNALIEGINDTLVEKDKSLSIVKLPNQNAAPKKLRFFDVRHVDGVIVTYSMPDWVANEVANMNVPTVWVNADIKHQKNSLIIDDVYCGRLITEHLIRLGHKNIVYANCSGNTHYSVPLRFEGHKQAMIAAGLTVHPYSEKYTPEGNLLDLVVGLLRSHDRPTAFACYSDDIALQIYNACYVCGLKIPDECSVIGINDMSFAGTAPPPLTTLGFPMYEMGQKAVEILIRSEKEPGYMADTMVFEPNLIVRKSTIELSVK